MSTGGSSKRNSHLAQWGGTRMIPMLSPLVFQTKGKKDRLIAGYPRPGSNVAFHTDVPNVMQMSKNR